MFAEGIAWLEQPTQ